MRNQNSRQPLAIILFAGMFLACANSSDSFAQTLLEPAKQDHIVIAIHDVKVERCVYSGIEFARADALARAIEESVQKQVQLEICTPTSLGTDSIDFMLISIEGQSARIFTTVDFATSRAIVNALKATGVQNTTLVGIQSLVELKTRAWLDKPSE